MAKSLNFVQIFALFFVFILLTNSVDAEDDEGKSPLASIGGDDDHGVELGFTVASDKEDDDGKGDDDDGAKLGFTVAGDKDDDDGKGDEDGSDDGKGGDE